MIYKKGKALKGGGGGGGGGGGSITPNDAPTLQPCAYYVKNP